jgi:hypothetical protein
MGASLASDGNNVYSIGGCLENAMDFAVTNDVGVYAVSGSSWTRTVFET